MRGSWECELSHSKAKRGEAMKREDLVKVERVGAVTTMGASTLEVDPQFDDVRGA